MRGAGTATPVGGEEVGLLRLVVPSLGGRRPGEHLGRNSCAPGLPGTRTPAPGVPPDPSAPGAGREGAACLSLPQDPASAPSLFSGTEKEYGGPISWALPKDWLGGKTAAEGAEPPQSYPAIVLPRVLPRANLGSLTLGGTSGPTGLIFPGLPCCGVGSFYPGLLPRFTPGLATPRPCGVSVHRITRVLPRDEKPPHTARRVSAASCLF